MPSGTKIVSAASGPYAVEANASKPNTGTPVATPSSSFLASEDFSGRPKSLSRSDTSTDKSHRYPKKD